MDIPFIINFTIGDGSLNLGDQIIRESINEILYELFKNDNVVIFNLSSHQPLSLVHKRFIRELRSKGARIIFMLSGANPLHFNYWPFATFNQWAIGISDILYINNVLLFGVGTAKPRSATLKSKITMIYSKHFWRKILNEDFVHAVRDRESVELLNVLGIRNVKNLGCPSMWKLTQEYIRRISKDKSDAVVTTLNSMYPSKEDYVLLKILIKKYRETYFWPQGYTDVYYIKKISQKLGISVKIIPPNLRTYDEFLSTYDVDYVGLRVHAGIRALQHKKRILIIAIDHRALSWSIDFGLPAIPRSKISILQDIIDQPISIRLKIPEQEIREYLINFRRYVLKSD